MIKLRRLSPLLALLLLLGGNTFAQGIEFLHDVPFDQLLKLAKEKNRIIFIDGYTKSCAPCKELDQQVFPLQEVGDYFNSNFINVKYDLEEPEGEKVRKMYKDVITGFPSLILMDQNGKMIHKMGGFHPADSLLAKLKAALNGHSLSAMRTRLQSGEKSLAFVREYKGIIKDGYLSEEAVAVDNKILNELSDEELMDPKMWKLVGSSVVDPYSPAFARVVAHYWDFQQHKVTDMAFLEFQLRTAIQRAADELVRPREEKEKLIITKAPEKEAILAQHISNPDLFKHSEAIKAMLYVHDLALKADWSALVSGLKYYHQINAFGTSSRLVYLNVQYMMQRCKDKQVLRAAAALIQSLPKEKLDVMDQDDNYETLIRLYELTGNKPAADKYKALQKS